MSELRSMLVRNWVRNFSITHPILSILAITHKNRSGFRNVLICVIFFWVRNTTELMTAFFTDALAKQQQQQNIPIIVYNMV